MTETLRSGLDPNLAAVSDSAPDGTLLDLGVIAIPNQLWYPGVDLSDEYPVPTDEELRHLFSNYQPGCIYSTEQVYGVYRHPEGKIRAIASVDLDEVLREAREALHEATGISHDNLSYAKGTWYDNDEVEVEYTRSVITDGLRVLMNNGLVEPVEGYDSIASLMRCWRRMGVYCVANTSTLPGCEPGTIDFLAKNFPNCFDGLLLPRNHDGNGKVTKAATISYLAEQIGVAVTNLPVVHIDDTLHHVQGFEAEFPELVETGKLRVFSPCCEDADKLSDGAYCQSSLEAFSKASVFFDRQLRPGVKVGGCND